MPSFILVLLLVGLVVSYLMRQKNPELAELMMVVLVALTVLPVQAFADIQSQHPDAVDIVSTRWVPFLRGGERLPADMPPLFVLETGEEPEMMADMVQRGIVQAYVSVRPDAQWMQAPERGMSADDILDLRYMLVTQENVREVLQSNGHFLTAGWNL